MNADILLGVVTALMAALGGIVSAHAPAKPKHKWAYGAAFVALGVFSIILIVTQSRATAKEQQEAQEKQRQIQEKLDSSRMSQEYMRGQLDSISVMIKKVGEKTTDPVLGQMAVTIARMADNARSSGTSTSTPDAKVQILFEGSELDGRTITLAAKQQLALDELNLRNVGGKPTGPVSVRLYFSKQINPVPFNGAFGIWEATASDESKFPYAYYGGTLGTPPLVNPQETWNWVGFAASLPDGLNEPLRCKVKVFYGAPKPAEANFTFRREGT